MLTRSRNLVIPGGLRACPFIRLGAPATPEGYLNILARNYEQMFEAYTPNSSKGGQKRVWKSFSHYKRWEKDDSDEICHNVAARYDHFTVNQWICILTSRPSDLCLHPEMDTSSVGTKQHWGPDLSGLPVHYNEDSFQADDYGFVPEPSNREDLERMALKVMSPTIRREVSLLNSLFELKDFRTLGKSLVGIRELVRRLRLSAVGSKTLAQLLRVSADSYLQGMFNFRPLLSDIAGLHRAMTKTLGRVKAQVAFEGRPQVAHFGYKWNEAPEVFEDSKVIPWDLQNSKFVILENFNTFQDNPELTMHRRVLTSPSVFHVQMRYTAKYPVSLPPELARGLALLDALGVNLNPEIIWNAIPWSFVVDWFVRVGEYLGSFKVGFMDPQVQVLEYLWSIKRKRVVERRLHYPTWAKVDGLYPHEPNGTEYTRFPDVYESSYRRSVGIPDPSLFSTSGLSLTELSLGIALGVSKTLSPKRSANRKPTNWQRSLERNLRRLNNPVKGRQRLLGRKR